MPVHHVYIDREMCFICCEHQNHAGKLQELARHKTIEASHKNLQETKHGIDVAPTITVASATLFSTDSFPAPRVVGLVRSPQVGICGGVPLLSHPRFGLLVVGTLLTDSSPIQVSDDTPLAPDTTAACWAAVANVTSCKTHNTKVVIPPLNIFLW